MLILRVRTGEFFPVCIILTGVGTLEEVHVNFLGFGTKLEKKFFFRKPQIFRNFLQKVNLKKCIKMYIFLNPTKLCKNVHYMVI